MKYNATETTQKMSCVDDFVDIARTTVRKTNPFIEELRKKNINVSNSIFQESCMIHDDISRKHGTKKGKSKLRLYLYCIMEASKRLRQPCLFNEIAKDLGLTKADLNLINKEYSTIQTGQKFVGQTFTPIDELSLVCNKLHITDTENIKRYAQQVLSDTKFEWKQENTRLVTLAIIYSYMSKIVSNYSNDEDTLTDLSHYNENSIRCLSKQITNLNI